jgi:hypothetical protein
VSSKAGLLQGKEEIVLAIELFKDRVERWQNFFLVVAHFLV